MKIIDLRWPWRSLTTSTVGYPSDSWAFCLIGLTAFSRENLWNSELWRTTSTLRFSSHDRRHNRPTETRFCCCCYCCCCLEWNTIRHDCKSFHADFRSWKTTTVIPRLHDRANIELARRAMVISMLIRRAGGL